ncbi:glycosyltransferase [Trujillonella endophytica]|uniref:glycosyltransferase n=1 Tax=Trujillonella endophytica TaxID=673521 RepID=UPI00147FB664|nr:glycosyltransferase [Trujillella endophytica]
MRVLHVINDAREGGGQTLIRHLGEHAPPELEVHLLVLEGPDVLSPRLEPHFRSTTYLDVSRSSWRLDRLVRDVSAAIEAIGPDVVQSHLLQSDLAVALGRRRRGGPKLVSTVHTTGYSHGDPLRTRVVARAMGVLSRRFDAVVACTDESRAYMRSRGYPRRRSSTISNGVPVVAMPKKGPRPRRLLVLARYNPMKDYPTLLRAFREVHRAHPDVRLACAGVNVDGTNAELTGLLAEYGLTDSVDLLGPVANVTEQLEGSAALVIASAYGEALPMAGLEAIACGTPVITTRVGGSPRFAVDDFQVVRPRHPGALSDALRHLLDLPVTEYDRLVELSHKRAAEDYDIAHAVRAYAELYRRLLGR